jgi:anti-anti-sigma regulatory factor
MSQALIQEISKKIFAVDNAKKTFTITLQGFAGSDSASVFVEALKFAVSKTKPQDLYLVVDSTNLKTFKSDILPVLEKSYKLYMSLGFKDIFMVNPLGATAKLQLQRMARTAQFTGKFVDTVADAQKQIA